MVGLPRPAMTLPSGAQAHCDRGNEEVAGAPKGASQEPEDRGQEPSKGGWALGLWMGNMCRVACWGWAVVGVPAGELLLFW